MDLRILETHRQLRGSLKLLNLLRLLDASLRQLGEPLRGSPWTKPIARRPPPWPTT